MKSNNLIIIEPQGYLDSSNATELFQSLSINKDCKNIFISFKKLISFNKPGVTNLVLSLRKLQDKYLCNIGFVNCSNKQVKQLIGMCTKENLLSLSIFDNENVLKLFTSHKKISKQDIQILKNDQASAILLELKSKDYDAKIVEEIEQYDNTLAIENTHIYSHSVTMPLFDKIDNTIIYHLTSFMDSSINNKFDFLFHQNLMRVGFRIFILDISSVSALNIDGIKFILKLYKNVIDNNSILAIYGLKENSISPKLKGVIDKSKIILVNNEKEIKGNSEILDELKTSIRKLSQINPIDKKAVTELNNIINPILESIQSFSTIKYKKQSIKAIKNIEFNIFDDYIAIILGQYGDFNSTITIILTKILAQKTVSFLVKNQTNIDNELEDIFSAISKKIENILGQCSLKIYTTPPRITDDIMGLAMFLKDQKAIEAHFKFDEEDLKIYIT